MSALAGKRILVVEDEPVVALLIRRQLASLGAHVVGPAATLKAALALVAEADFDAALLDMNLRGEPVDRVAEALAARGAPFVYATGYGGLSSGQAQAPVVAKPFRVAQLEAALAAALKSA